MSKSLLLSRFLVLLQDQIQPFSVVGNDVLVPIYEQWGLEKLVRVNFRVLLVDELFKSLVNVSVLVLREDLEPSVVSYAKTLHGDGGMLRFGKLIIEQGKALLQNRLAAVAPHAIGVYGSELVVCGHLLGVHVQLEEGFVVVQLVVGSFQMSKQAGQGWNTGIVEDGDRRRGVLQRSEERHVCFVAFGGFMGLVA